MNSFPKISIITPSFNQGAYLEETILSVLNQNYPNLEYIVIDGGSKDESVEIIKKYADRLTYWISEKDNGQSEAINKGLKKASGEIVAWLNSDDCYTKNTFFEIAKTFSENNKCDIVYGDVVNFDTYGKEKRIYNQFEILDFFSRVSLHQPGIFWRVSLHTEAGYIDESLKYCMDYDLWMRLFINYPSIHLPMVVARFREHPDSKTNANPIELYQEYQVIVKRFFQSLPNKDWKEKLRKIDYLGNFDSNLYSFKKDFSSELLEDLFYIYLQKCLEIEYSQKQWLKVNRLFLSFPKLIVTKKGFLIFLKTNSLFIFMHSNN